MGDQEVKVRITTDASGAVTGFKQLREEISKTEKESAGFASKIKSHWLGLSAAVAGAMAGAYKAWDMMGRAADYAERIEGITLLGQQYGMTGTQITRSMTEAARGMISLSEAADMAAKSVNMGLNPNQMTEYTRVAERLGDVTGQTIPAAYDKMVSSAAKGRLASLREMGIIVDLDKAYELHAKTLGRNADSLSETEQMSVRVNAVLDAAKLKVSAFGEPVDSTRDKMDRMTATLKNVELLLGQGLIRAGAGAIGLFESVAAAALKLTQGLFKIIEGYHRLMGLVAMSGSAAESYHQNAAAGWRMDADAAGGAAAELWSKAKDNFSMMISTTDELAAASKRSIVPTITDTSNLGKTAEELKKSWADVARNLNATIAGQGLTDIEKKLISNQKEAEKLAEKYGKLPGALALINQARTVEDIEAITAAEKSGASSYERLVREEIDAFDKAAKDKLEAERDLYTDLRGYEDSYYQSSLALIASQVEKYRGMKIDEIAITAWAEEEKRKARLKYDRETGTQDMGFYQGLSDWRTSLQTDFEFGEDLAKTTATSMQRTFSNVFFDAFKGDLKDFKTYWDSFCDAILRKFTDRVADMVTSWVMGLAEMKSAENSSGLSGLISGAGSLLSSLFGGSSGAGLGVAGGTAADAVAAGAIVLHGGGVVGIDSAPVRYVPALAFSGAPRYHKGFMPGERPAILKDDEGVFTSAQMKKLAPASGEGQTHITIVAMDSKSFEEFAYRNASIFQNVTTKGLEDNKTRSRWKSLLK